MTVAQGHMPTGPHHLAAEREVRWPNLTRIVFRFGFAYVLLFLGSFAAFFSPLTIPISALSEAVWGAVVPWVAREILRVPSPPLTSDGDGLAQWIQVGRPKTRAISAVTPAAAPRSVEHAAPGAPVRRTPAHPPPP